MKLSPAQVIAMHKQGLAQRAAIPVPAGTDAEWNAEVPRIRASGTLAAELLEAHERTVECRSDLTPCQKRARRRLVLDAWRKVQERA